MTKKDTTGGPTRRKRESEQDEGTYLSRAEREARAQKWLLLAIGVTLGVMLIILLVGIIYEGLIYPNQAVAVVDGTSVSTTDFEQRVRYERWALGQQLQNIAAVYGPQALYDENSPFYQQFTQLAPGQDYIMGRRAREAMVEELLIRAAADELGITVTEKEIEARVQEYFGYDPNPEPEEPVVEPADESEEDSDAGENADAEDADAEEDADADDADADEDADAGEDAAAEDGDDADADEDTEAEAESTPLPTLTPAPTLPPPPTLTPEERAERYEETSTDYFAEATEVSGMSAAEILAIFEVDVLRTKLRDEVVDEVGTTEEQVNARHILVETEEEALEVLAALEDGEAFADLAVERSIDPSAADNSGELGWNARGLFVPEFEETIFSNEVGLVAESVMTQFGYHVIEVLGREDRELTESEIEQKRATAFNTWLQEQRFAVEIEYPNDYVGRTPSDPTVYDLDLVGTVSQ